MTGPLDRHGFEHIRTIYTLVNPKSPETDDLVRLIRTVERDQMRIAELEAELPNSKHMCKEPCCEDPPCRLINNATWKRIREMENTIAMYRADAIVRTSEEAEDAESHV